MTWDELGLPWLVLKASAPKPLFNMTNISYSVAETDIKKGARIFALPGGLVTLPKGYTLAACTPRPQ